MKNVGNNKEYVGNSTEFTQEEQNEIRQLAVEIDQFMDDSDPYGYRMEGDSNGCHTGGGDNDYDHDNDYGDGCGGDYDDYERSIARNIADIEAAIMDGDVDGNIRIFLDVAIASADDAYNAAEERKRGRVLLKRLESVLKSMEKRN